MISDSLEQAVHEIREYLRDERRGGVLLIHPLHAAPGSGEVA